ncbi:MAG: tRNA preQ1(34) S-adenosylmethionine ribosyltransferase-isomerase QueA [Phycisphaeraceae bacterium]|nr:tRNA preQ1(34) S-adenosylmethionine ribosyltransferase-isomerase QueA [Phycisphaeraceae bacterium]
MLRTDALDYDLPTDLIATHPAVPRESARLLVVRRSVPDSIQDRQVSDLPDLLLRDDLLVVNRSRVLPARFVGRRTDTRGGVQGLFLSEEREAGTWEVMLKARRFRAGAVVEVFDRHGLPSDVRLTLMEPSVAEPGAWVVAVSPTDGAETVLSRVGLAPLPPYILAARRNREEACDDAADRGQYQTVYAREAGSIAAPTAGLHFTEPVLEAVRSHGVEVRGVVLHVGTGTFRPVESEVIEDHPMHEEWCSMDRETIDAVRDRASGVRPGRVIAVGTTAARTLETYASGRGTPHPIRTRLLITPGYRLRWTHGLLTNFHLPRSTLLAMVAALFPGGVKDVLGIYRHAIDRRYRFYSFGDAMLILP